MCSLLKGLRGTSTDTSETGLICSTDLSSVTRVDPDLFVLPVKRLGVSGGTAPFFQLKLRRSEDGKSVDYYIGKDLSHATDEIDFYEKLLLIKNHPGADKDLVPLLGFAFEYAGVLTASEEGADESESPHELLVLRNLRDGMKKLRLMDLKIGQQTAQAGWHGKTRLHAMKQVVLDASTNSTTEGFRLEGFDGRPGALASKEPLMDALPPLQDSFSTLKAGDSTKKKVNRMIMQQMRGHQVFRHFIDLHLDFSDLSDKKNCYEPIEVGEIVLHTVVERLIRLLLACYKAPVPQKWIGSSVALGYDAGTLPKRSSGSEEKIRSTVLVNVFDWGRSELNTVEAFNEMNDAEKEDRRRFWSFYTNGIRSLSWNAAKEYRNRFGNVGSWEELQIRVYDYDSTSKDDFCCQTTVPVRETKKTWTPLKGRILGLKVKGSLLYSIEWHDAPSSDCRLKGWYRLYIGEGKDLPIMDRAKGGKSDPYCVITARSSCGKYKFKVTTSTKAQDLNPKWGEFFDIPIPKESNQLAKAVEKGCGYVHKLSPSWLDSFLGADSSGPERWGDLLKAVSGAKSAEQFSGYSEISCS